MKIFIASPLEPELVERLRRELPDATIAFEPDLLPPTRYRGDHRGEPGFRRSAAAEARWQALLAGAEVIFGIPGEDPQQLRRLVAGSSKLRFVQATAAGAGEQVAAAGLSTEDLERVLVATASGVHGGPLAEFTMLGILAFARGLPRLQSDRAEHRWDHYPTSELTGRTVVILGIGAIGSRIAHLSKAFGMYVIGVNSDGRPTAAPVDEHATPAELPELAARADVLVVTLPATDDTVGLVSRAVLKSLPPGAIVINVGRGSVIDEQALIDSLRSGHLAGAALDVAAQEPPVDDSPLWELPNLILSPHTAALSPLENERIVALFADNVRRLADGRPLRNRISAHRAY